MFFPPVSYQFADPQYTTQEQIAPCGRLLWVWHQTASFSGKSGHSLEKAKRPKMPVV
jgi:hypothetical protein